MAVTEKSNLAKKVEEKSSEIKFSDEDVKMHVNVNVNIFAKNKVKIYNET